MVEPIPVNSHHWGGKHTTFVDGDDLGFVTVTSSSPDFSEKSPSGTVATSKKGQDKVEFSDLIPQSPHAVFQMLHSWDATELPGNSNCELNNSPETAGGNLTCRLENALDSFKGNRRKAALHPNSCPNDTHQRDFAADSSVFQHALGLHRVRWIGHS